MRRRAYVSRDERSTDGGGGISGGTGRAGRESSRALRRLGHAALLLALALSAGGCTTFKRFAYEGFGDRDGWQQPDRVVAALGIEPGMTVADLGAGGGYFSFLLATAVGNQGRCLTVDVDEDMNAYLREEASDRGQGQLEVIDAALDDPLLPVPVDLVFTSNTYHHLSDHVAYFSLVRERYLKPGGRLAVIDFRPEITSHSTDPAQIRRELEAAGFQLIEDHAWLERQSFQIFGVAAQDAAAP